MLNTIRLQGKSIREKVEEIMKYNQGLSHKDLFCHIPEIALDLRDDKESLEDFKNKTDMGRFVTSLSKNKPGLMPLRVLAQENY